MSYLSTSTRHRSLLSRTSGSSPICVPDSPVRSDRARATSSTGACGWSVSRQFLAEESDAVPTASGYTWIIDPLDGTRNYILGIPFFCTVLALAFGDEVILGLTNDPVRREMFQAVKGGGVFLNGIPISVSRKTNLENALLSYDLGYVDEKASTAIEMALHLWPTSMGTRTMGSAVLAPKAGGIITGKHTNPASLQPESVIAAGKPLLARFLWATEGLAWRR